MIDWEAVPDETVEYTIAASIFECGMVWETMYIENEGGGGGGYWGLSLIVVVVARAGGIVILQPVPHPFLPARGEIPSIVVVARLSEG